MEKIIYIVCLCLLASCAHVPTKVEAINKPETIKKPSTIVVKVVPPVKKKTIELLFPVRGAHISSEFGWRGSYYHRGVDLAAPVGTPIKACMDGTVVSAGRVKFLTGYGNAVLIKHRDHIYTYYAHLQTIKLQAGTMVKQGQVIGNVGNTGKSKGPHLHIELIIKGSNHNPVPYFFIENSRTESAMLWLKGVKKSVATGLGLRKLIGE